MAKRKNNKKRNEDDLIVFNEDRNEDCEGAVRKYKPLPNRIQKGPYESQDQFMSRLNRLIGKAMCEAEIEQKYDVDFCERTGKNDFDEIFKPGKTISKKKQEKRKQRDRKRKERKNLKKQSNQDEFKSKFENKIEFGDYVQSPPDLDRIKLKFNETIAKMKNKVKKIKHLN